MTFDEPTSPAIPADNAGSAVAVSVASADASSSSGQAQETARLILLINTPGDFRQRVSELTAALQAWSGCEAVGIRLRDGDDYPYYETRGFPPRFVQAETHLCAYGSNGCVLRDSAGHAVLECMCGNILRGRFDPTKPFFTAHGSFWSNGTTALLASTTEADRQARTRNRCNREGYESVALIPLRAGGQVFGLLQFNDHRTNRFTPDLIAHFEAMADGLAIALSQRQAEESLRESEERYQRITQAITDYIFTVRVVDGRVAETTHGPGCVTITGYRDEEFASDPFLWFRMVEPEDRPEVEKQSQRVLAGEDPPPLEHRIIRKNGTVRWVRNTFVPHRNAQGALVSYDGLIQDITERVRMEAEKAELEAHNRQLQKSESLGRMAGAIAHHFNNQLQVVLGSLELALGKLPGDAGHIAELLTCAMQAARRAAEVSSGMLTYLGHTRGKQESLDLSEVCRRNLPMLLAAMPKGVAMESVLPSPGPIVSANANQIQQVLANLLTNAWEAIGNGTGEQGGQGTIRLSVTTVAGADIPVSGRFPIDAPMPQDAYACMEIAGTGCGIAARDIDKLFDPFYSTKFTGRGMGLPMALGIVRAHAGVFTVQSEPGHGSLFRVYLPLAAVELPKPMAKPARPPVLAQSGTALLVDDDQSVREVATMLLTALGFTVLQACDGVEAVELFRKHRPEIRCVLCDLTMPRMNGWQTLDALRELGSAIPVVLASGYNEAQVMAGDHPHRPQAFLSKPFGLAELTNAIHQCLAGK